MKEMGLAARGSEICREVDGRFAIFGGYITGRQQELLPNERIVEAWRARSWDRGVYSTVRFELVEMHGATRIVFEHTGFPAGAREQLAYVWRAHYWQPLRKLLASLIAVPLT